MKGGVGKSTLSVLTALGLARRGDRQVTLVDMDLTGTSLADVLPLEAPAWPGNTSALRLLEPPAGFHSREATRERMDDRELLARQQIARDPESSGAFEARGVPFLNDFLLFATPDWDEQREMPVASVLWRMQDAPEQALRVIPSSALPSDLERILPVVFDENHSGFLENRLEYLLDALVPEQGESVVVMDTPPTIPGLSRSVLSLALRLSKPHKQHLAEQGGMPERLEAAPVEWTAFVVGSMDHQDIRAANRWLSLVLPEERPRIRFLVNRIPPGDELQIRGMLEDILERENAAGILLDAVTVREDVALQLFRSRELKDLPPDALDFLGGV
ncbi:MAG TPA: P-loop NTPase [Archangium sp.]|uniref:P-loop NTPase n=1 Tax=Archangium sp. TaxID=1872627 RepID=UPI002E377C3E|nr:P-loop NTPase [Archangium sp.]HEX5751288.1 P-loop NTPase [Archangium sp.]